MGQVVLSCVVQRQGYGAGSVETRRVPQVQFLDKVVVLPVMVQDKSFGPDSAENRAALGQAVVLPVMVQDRVLVQTVRKLFWRFRRCSSGVVVDNLALMQRRLGGPSDSVTDRAGMI